MTDETQTRHVKIRARSPGKYPILVLESPSGELRAAYYETAYDLEQAKPVSEEWMRENALGRHSFIAVEPPEEIPAEAVEDYVLREILGSP